MREVTEALARQVLRYSQRAWAVPLLIALVLGLTAQFAVPLPWWCWLLVIPAALGARGIVRRSATQAAREAALGPDQALEEMIRRVPFMGEGTALPRGQGSHQVLELDRLYRALQRRALEITEILTAQRRLAGDAAHQLRTPLSALTMRLDEIALSEDIEVVHEEADRALTQVERLTQVVQEMLEPTRNGAADQAGVAGLSTPVASLDAVIAAQQREWQTAFARAGRNMRVTGTFGLFVACPRGVMAQALSTLIENSLIHGAGLITLHIDHNGPSVLMVLSDEGPGITEEIADRVFERRVTSGRGTGLGLALARDLVTSAGGRLELLDRERAAFGLFFSEPAEESEPR